MRDAGQVRARGFRTLLTALAILVGAWSVAGCETLRSMTPSGRKAKETEVRLQQLQARNMRFSDDYVGRLMEAERLARPSLNDADQRMRVSGWLLGQANAAYITASGENPIIATLDLLTLAALSRMLIEDSVAPRYPAETECLLAAHRQLEAEAWELASTVLDPAQQATVRSLIVEWHKRNPDFENVTFVRFQDFVSVIGGEDAGQPGSMRSASLFGLIGLDPLAGLDPAVEQVELSRLLAQRAIFYAQRVPTLMDLQLERSLSRIAAGPESKRLQQQTASLTQSAERFAGVAEGLPDVIARERGALIRQTSDALSAQEATLRPMLAELRGALLAGDATATSVDQAARSIDALLARFAAKPGSADTQPGKPFDIDEYTRAAEEITRAANQLQQLLGTVGTQAPQLDRAVDASLLKGQSFVDYVFVRIAWLIVLLLVGILAVLLMYRWLTPRSRS